jgi:hypothetical protein
MRSNAKSPFLARVYVNPTIGETRITLVGIGADWCSTRRVQCRSLGTILGTGVGTTGSADGSPGMLELPVSVA